MRMFLITVVIVSSLCALLIGSEPVPRSRLAATGAAEELPVATKGASLQAIGWRIRDRGELTGRLLARGEAGLFVLQESGVAEQWSEKVIVSDHVMDHIQSIILTKGMPTEMPEQIEAQVAPGAVCELSVFHRGRMIRVWAREPAASYWYLRELTEELARAGVEREH